MAHPAHPFEKLLTPLNVGENTYQYYDLSKLGDARVGNLPFSIRVLLEAAIRNCDNFAILETDIAKILDWEVSATAIEIPFKPARVVMQDFTGVPAVVDLAAMRDATSRLGGDPRKINPLVPVDLVIDHSVQVDKARSADALEFNSAKEFERNHERFSFLKWGSTAFDGLTIVPPGNGIVHQVNLEYLARSVFNDNGVLYPDSVVGTDSHTTMINGLGVLGWGVGGIEAEAAMLGVPMSMVLPAVVGYKLTGTLAPGATATDLVLTITQNLRKHGVVEKFVEFYGPGVAALSLADRATISNMAPEYGATCGYFPVDEKTIAYLQQTGRDAKQIAWIEAYFKAQHMFGCLGQGLHFTEHLELDIGTVVPCVAGPKRPHDRVALTDMKRDFEICMDGKAGFKGFGIPPEKRNATANLTFQGQEYTLTHGSVVIASITSCTNTSNPSVLVAAGLVARKARAIGLRVKPYIKTSLSPGSGVVSHYLSASGLQEDLTALGFDVVGYGCMTCIGNSGELLDGVHEAFEQSGVVASAVLSGNRNFEARVHPITAANYLASPPLVVAYALAGTVDIDLTTAVIGTGKDGQNVFLRDLWPTTEEIEAIVARFVTAETFKAVYSKIKEGNKRWDELKVATGEMFQWDDKSTYIHNPPFFQAMGKELPEPRPITDAYCLLNLGDSVTTDHISPAGNIAKNSPAAKYLTEHGVDKADFNTYGARRGNDLVMARGTFANTRLSNKIVGPGNTGPITIHIPTGEVMPIFDAAERYQKGNQNLIILAGKEYGSGSSRDWAAKGPYLQGVKAVIAESFERIHRSNLVGMGIIPFVFKPGQNAESLGLKGNETFTIDLPADLKPGMDVDVRTNTGVTFQAVLRFATPVEITYWRNGGILHFVLRKILTA